MTLKESADVLRASTYSGLEQEEAFDMASRSSITMCSWSYTERPPRYAGEPGHIFVTPVYPFRNGHNPYTSRAMTDEQREAAEKRLKEAREKKARSE